MAAAYMGYLRFMNKLKQIALILERQKIDSFAVSGENTIPRVVILNRKLWERKMLLLLTAPMLVLDDDDEEVQGYCLDLVTCNAKRYSEYTLFEVTDDRNAWELAQMIAGVQGYIEALELEQCIPYLMAQAVSQRQIENNPEDTTHIDIGPGLERGRTGFQIRTEPGQSGDGLESYLYNKSVFDLLMEGATTMLAPLNLNF